MKNKKLYVGVLVAACCAAVVYGMKKGQVVPGYQQTKLRIDAAIKANDVDALPGLLTALEIAAKREGINIDATRRKVEPMLNKDLIKFTKDLDQSVRDIAEFDKDVKAGKYGTAKNKVGDFEGLKKDFLQNIADELGKHKDKKKNFDRYQKAAKPLQDALNALKLPSGEGLKEAVDEVLENAAVEVVNIHEEQSKTCTAADVKQVSDGIKEFIGTLDQHVATYEISKNFNVAGLKQRLNAALKACQDKIQPTKEELEEARKKKEEADKLKKQQEEAARKKAEEEAKKNQQQGNGGGQKPTEVAGLNAALTQLGADKPADMVTLINANEDNKDILKKIKAAIDSKEGLKGKLGDVAYGVLADLVK